MTAFVLAAAALGAAGDAGAQSYDCRKAHFADERTVCTNAALSLLDEQLNAVYSQTARRLAPAEQRALHREEDSWVVGRRRCGSDERCIAAAYRSRIGELSETLRDRLGGSAGMPPTEPSAAEITRGSDTVPSRQGRQARREAARTSSGKAPAEVSVPSEAMAPATAASPPGAAAPPQQPAAANSQTSDATPATAAPAPPAGQEWGVPPPAIAGSANSASGTTSAPGGARSGTTAGPLTPLR